MRGVHDRRRGAVASAPGGGLGAEPSGQREEIKLKFMSMKTNAAKPNGNSTLSVLPVVLCLGLLCPALAAPGSWTQVADLPSPAGVPVACAPPVSSSESVCNRLVAITQPQRQANVVRATAPLAVHGLCSR